MKDCNQCGKCCTKYGGSGGLSASTEEIKMWDLFRPDIAEYVKDGQIWVSPETGLQLEVCPWLRKMPTQEKYTCDIYLDRPDDCKFYPTTIAEMVVDECEMIEVRDLSNPKRAQKELDVIMIDSRPPVE